MTRHDQDAAGLEAALSAATPAARLQAALFAGTDPGTVAAETLIHRCAVEPDFFVRDTLSWALTRYDRAATVDRLLDELGSDVPQARGQALHTLSKIGDQRAWEAVTGFLADGDLEIARVAWRAAAALVPDGRRRELADRLATQFGRGDAEAQRSLSRALAALGQAAVPSIERAKAQRTRRVRAHAMATERLLQDPDVQFDAASTRPAGSSPCTAPRRSRRESMLIGELAERCGISARMLRHYDRIGLVSPTSRTPSGYREYSTDDVRRLFHVEGLRTLGLSLQEVAGVLADLSFDPAAMVADLAARTRERLRYEQELLDRLSAVAATEATAWSEVLDVIGLLRGLGADDPSARLRVALAQTGGSTLDAATLAEAALNEADPQVANALHWALARHGDRAIPILAGALTSVDAERSQRAAAALAKIGSAEALAVLSQAVGSPDPLVAMRATLASGRLGRPDAIPALVALVASGPNDVEAAEVLGRLARDEALCDEIATTVAAVLAGAEAHIGAHVDAAARQRLATALAEIPGERADSILAGLATDDDRGVSTAAGFVLGGRRTRPGGGSG